MKRNSKKVFSIFVVLSLFLININTVNAFSFNKKHNNTQAAKTVKQKSIKKSKNNTEQVIYNNEIHSVFSLNDCIENAIKYNPGIQASILNEQIYKSKIGQAWSNYFPSISAGIEASRSGNKYTGETVNGINTQYTTMGYIPTVSADMLLFDFGKTKASADMAKRTYESVQEDTKENINSIIYNIKSAYYNLLFAQAQVKVYEDTVTDYKLQLEQAKGFYRYGTKPKLDVVTAEYNLGKAQLNLVKAKSILEVTKVNLSQIMGMPEYTNYELSDNLTLNLFDITEENAINTAMELRPELVAAKKSSEAAKMNLRSARRTLTPDLGLYGSYGNGIGNQYNLQSAQIGLGLNYNSLNLFKVKKQIDEAKAKYKKSIADYNELKHEVYFNVKKNYLELETNREAIVIAKLSLDQAKEQYRQVTGRYKAGVGDAIELKDGENTYLNARLDFYNAILNYNLSGANLEKEVGSPIRLRDEKILDIPRDDL